MTNDPPLPDAVACILRPTRVEEVDEATYLAANPDVAKTGEAAVSHFCASGRAQGRLQWANLDTVAQLRARKLARIQWRGQPVCDFVEGEAANFLSAETIRAFGIPEEVPVSAHQYRAPIVELIHANRDKLLLDVGAGLRHTYYANVVNVDIFRSVCTDVICVGEALPFADEQFDFIFCFAVTGTHDAPMGCSARNVPGAKARRHDNGGLAIPAACARLSAPLFQCNAYRKSKSI